MTNIHQKSDVPSNVERATGIFDKYGDFIRSVIRFHIRNEPEAEDVFQDLFLSLVAKPIPLEVQNVKGYLYKILCDTVKDAYRRINRYQSRINRYTRRNLCVAENRPETELMSVEEAEKMFDLIERQLPAQEALAVTLRYRDDYNTGEVAEMMGVKQRSVSRYVSVGLKKISNVFTKTQGGNNNSF